MEESVFVAFLSLFSSPLAICSLHFALALGTADDCTVCEQIVAIVASENEGVVINRNYSYTLDIRQKSALSQNESE